MLFLSQLRIRFNSWFPSPWSWVMVFLQEYHWDTNFWIIWKRVSWRKPCVMALGQSLPLVPQWGPVITSHGSWERWRAEALSSIPWLPWLHVWLGAVQDTVFVLFCFFLLLRDSPQEAKETWGSALGRSGWRLLLSVTVSEMQVGNSKYKTDEQRRQQSGTSNISREKQNRLGRVLQSAHQIYMQIVMLTLYMINCSLDWILSGWKCIDLELRFCHLTLRGQTGSLRDPWQNYDGTKS